MNQLNALNSIETESFDYDVSEILNLSSLSLIKMLRHGKAGIPIEVMGLMLGKFIDQTHIQVQDVFAMPQTGTGVSVEAIDPVFQTKMLDMYEQNGSSDVIVGWYHSHPGFGCWLSGVDINTQQNFEYLNKRSVAVVIDPVQSVNGKVVIEAYRLNSPLSRVQETRDISSIYSMVNNPSLFREDHGLNKYYYSLRVGFRKNLLEEITVTSIYQKDCKELLSKKFTKNLLELKLLDVFTNLIVSLKEIFYSEFFLLKSTNSFLIQSIKKELTRLRSVIKSVTYKLSLFCLYDTLIRYIS
jgi:proteasome lid subunit RPN8/RPN11